MPGAIYVEQGASWWPVLWGPALAALGITVEVSTPGPKHPVSWFAVGVILALVAVVWIRARRRLCSVWLTGSQLTVGGEVVPLERIMDIAEGNVPVGARILGGGAVAPKGTGEVPLLLRDGTVVVGWARDPEALTGHLHSLLRSPR